MCCVEGEYPNNADACTANGIENCKVEEYNANGNICNECNTDYKIITNGNGG